MSIAAILGLITALEPAVVNTILLIKNKATGQVTAIAVLDSVDAAVAANQTAIQTWLSGHPSA